MAERRVKEKIIKLLSKHNYGLTIEEIANSLKINRMTTSKYLAVLEATGKIIVREVGKAKLHYPKTKNNNKWLKLNKKKSSCGLSGVGSISFLLILLLTFIIFFLITAIITADTIDSCQDLTSPNTIYELNQSVNSSGTCFNITAHNITLDCKGYNITYATSVLGYGINNSLGYDNITIKNCELIQTGGTGSDPYDAIHFTNSSNSRFINNTPTATRGYGIRLDTSHNASITNNTFPQTSYFPAIYLYLSDNATIENNNMTSLGGRNYANFCPKTIWLRDSRWAELYNNNITTNRWHSLELRGSEASHFNHTIGEDNKLNNKPIKYIANVGNTTYQDENWTGYDVVIAGVTNVTFANLTIDHIYFGDDVVNSTFENSTVKSTYLTAIDFYRVTNFELRNNLINHTLNNRPITIRKDGTTNLNIINNTIINNGTAITVSQPAGDSNFNLYNNTITSANGPAIYSYPRYAVNTFEGNTITITGDSNDYGICFDLWLDKVILKKNKITSSGIVLWNILDLDVGSRIIIVNDSILNSTNNFDLLIDNNVGGEINFTNVTLANNNKSINETSDATLNVFWYMDVNTTDSSGDPLSDINVTIKDKDGTVIYNGLTGANGLIPTQVLQEYWQNASDSYYYTNYTVNVSKYGYFSNSTKVNLTTNKQIYFTLEKIGCDVFDNPGTYTLITNTLSNGTCITIASDNISLNCDGYSINGNTTGMGINNTGGYDNITLSNCIIQNFSQAINFNNSVNTSFFDSVIQNSSNVDVYTEGNSNITFLNTTFNKSSTDITGGTLYVKWYLDVYVNDTQGDPVNSANVTTWDKNSTQVFSELTASNGYISQQNLTEYYENSTTKYYYTNYTMNASKIHYSTKTIQVNLTINKEIYLTLDRLPINISLNLDPNPVNTNQNVSVYGHVNESDGTNITNKPVNIYVNESLYYYNTGLLENVTTPWWNTSWGHRTKIQTESLVATTLNNTIIMINFSTSEFISQGKMNSDCGDVRLIDSNGNELSHTLETSTCNSSNTIFWAWANLTGNSNTTTYAYYSNTGASLKTDYTNPDQDLVLYIHFDNNSAYGENDTYVFDFSKYGNNGTASGDPSWNSSCKFGGCFYFNESENDDFIVASNPSLEPANTLTIMTWMKADNVSGWTEFISKSSNGNWCAYCFSDRNQNSSVYFLYNISTSGNDYVTADVDVWDNQWHHLVGRYNGTHTSIFVDGEEKNSEPESGAFTYGNYDFNVANFKSGSIDYYTGYLDEVRVYNRTLSEDEISAIYNSTKDNYVSNHSLPKTDSGGNYNYTLTAPNITGNYEIKVNTTYNGMDAETNKTLVVIIGILNLTLQYPEIVVPEDYYFYENLTVFQSDSQDIYVYLNKTDTNNFVKFVNSTGGETYYQDDYNLSLPINTYESVTLRVYVPGGMGYDGGTYNIFIYAYSLNDSRSDTTTPKVHVNTTNPIDDIEILNIYPPSLYSGESLDVNISIHKIFPIETTDIQICYCMDANPNYQCGPAYNDYGCEWKAITTWLNYTKTVTVNENPEEYYFIVAVKYPGDENIKRANSPKFYVLSTPGPGPSGIPGGFIPSPISELTITAPNQLEAAPGERIEFDAEIENTGDTNAPDTSLDIYGLPEGWFSIIPSSQDIGIGESKNYSVLISLPRTAPEQIYFISLVAKSGSVEATKAITMTIAMTPEKMAKFLLEDAQSKKREAEEIIETARGWGMDTAEPEETLTTTDGVLDEAMRLFESGDYEESSEKTKQAIEGHKSVIDSVKEIVEEACFLLLNEITTELEKPEYLEEKETVESINQKVNQSRILQREGRIIEVYRALLEAKQLLDQLKGKAFPRELIQIALIVLVIIIMIAVILRFYRKRTPEFVKTTRIENYKGNMRRMFEKKAKLKVTRKKKTKGIYERAETCPKMGQKIANRK